MKGRRILVGLLMVLNLIVLTAAPALADAVGPYYVTYVGYQYDYPEQGRSTWYYTVTSSESAHAISHLVFELGACCSVVDAGEWTDFTTLDSWWGTSKIEVKLDNVDPTTQIYGIKFDDTFVEGTTRNYYFTVQGNHALAPDGITVAIKTGGGSALLMRGATLLASVSGLLTRGLSLAAGDWTTYEESIYGPDLDCHTTAVTLNNFSASSPAGSLAPALLIPAALLGMAVLVPGAVVLTCRLRRQEL